MTATESLPNWLPDRVRFYLGHTEEGLSLRALARRSGVNASTVLRHVRRYESRRDDPLMDGALSALAVPRGVLLEPSPKAGSAVDTVFPDEVELKREARRLLRRLAEPGAALVFAPEMARAIVLREFPDGRSARTAVLDRAVAQAFSLKDWISCRSPGRVSRYEITTAGRSALRVLLDEEAEARLGGFSEARAGFQAAPQRSTPRPDSREEEDPRRIRLNVSDTPVAVLGRRRDRDGRPFLPAELVAASERLREDFELANVPVPAGGEGQAQARARLRIAAAMEELGPGLGEIAMRVCCHLEGIETTERRMGWAARSGKIVLRIALMRLQRHQERVFGTAGPLIG